MEKPKFVNDYAERMRKRELLKKLNSIQLKQLAQKYCESDNWSFRTMDPVSEWSESTMIDKLEDSETLSANDIISQTRERAPEQPEPDQQDQNHTKKWEYEDEVIDTLNKFSVIYKKDMKEADVETQLEQALRFNHIPPNEVTHQHNHEHGRGDILVGKHILIEEKKIANPTLELSNIMGQLIKYRKVYPRLFVVLYDPFNKIQDYILKTFKDDLRKHNISNCTVYRKT